MGDYAAITFLTREFRSDADVDSDAIVAGTCRTAAERDGYHPDGEPRITWYPITQDEVTFGAVPKPFRAGDWRVRAVVSVTEDSELVA